MRTPQPIAAVSVLVSQLANVRVVTVSADGRTVIVPPAKPIGSI